MTPQVQPLSHRHRNVFFYLLMGVFIAALPFLFLYASGYRFYLGDGSLVSTGGLYIAAERTGAEIYINDQLVRETRVFRRAFYAQGLAANTYRVHVQKENHHTWIKELPIYPHLVTEAQAFNLPITPTVRVISERQTPAGVAMLTFTPLVLEQANAQNQLLIESRALVSTMPLNLEYREVMKYFTTAATSTVSSSNPAVTSAATTTKEVRGVSLYEEDGAIFARYIGPKNSMPYYYCAEEFDPYVASSTAEVEGRRSLANVAKAQEPFDSESALQVQTVSTDTACEPVITMDTGGEEISYFDFFPGSTDLVIMAGQSGVYVVEIDDRAWQNRQMLLGGENLAVRVVESNIYVYDGDVIYQIQTAQNWF
jgi:hypothetical protein